MANEHSIRVTARGEFGQLNRGLGNLKKDLNSVLGEIDKGARRGGVFDESQLRALSLYRARFKETMGELNREFEKQNEAVERLHRLKERASQEERSNIDKQIKKREKELDVIRRQLLEVEKLYNRRNKEANGYNSITAVPTNSGSMIAQRDRGFIENATSGLMGGALGAGKFALGLAGIGGIMSIVGEAYQKAFESQVTPMNLAQRLRGTGAYNGSAKNMWDEIGGIGRNDRMGYTSQESWQFMDMYSRQAGALNPYETEHALKFGRAYGLEVGETASALSSVREIGGATSPSEFADMIASSVGQSGMTPRILEVMETSAGLLQQMNVTLKDTGAKQILAYQTTLDTIGMDKGMMKLTGQQGANIISGLGGIFNPNQQNDWKWMGIQALQGYDSKKYGNMDLYGLERTFEEGLLNPDNLPAMSKYLKQNSGGNTQLEKRMIQRWLQDGGYNATKTQVDDLYTATDGLTVFDESKMKDIMDSLESGDAEAKYMERQNQLGQEILDVNSRFEKQLENLGQPLLEIMTGVKGGITDILEHLTENGAEKAFDKIHDFLEDNWGLLATAVGVAGLSKILSDRLPKPGGGKGTDTSSDGREKGEQKDTDDKNSSSSKNAKNGRPPIVPLAGMGLLGKLALGVGTFFTGKGFLDGFSTEDKKQHAQWAENAGINPDDISWFDRGLSNTMNALTGGMLNQEEFYQLFNAETKTKVKKSFEDFFAELFPSLNIPKTKEQEKNLQEMSDAGNQKMNWYEYANPEKWGDIKIPESWGKNFEEMKTGFFDNFITPMNEAMGWDIGGKKRDEAVQSLIGLGSTGTVSIEGLTSHGQTKLQELADKGLVKLEEFSTSGYTAVEGLNTEGKAKLQELADQGLISIQGLQTDGSVSITALSDEGKAKLQELKDHGVLTYDQWYTGTTATLSGFSEEGKSKLKELQEQGLINIGGFTSDGKAKLTVLSEEGRAKLEKLKEKGLIDISSFSEDGKVKITSLSEEGAKQLLDLQKNGSLSMDGMDKNTDEKLGEIKKNNREKLDEIHGEHKSLVEKLTGKDGIFTKWADGFGSLWDKFVESIKDLLPFGWGSGDSNMGYWGLSGGGKAISKDAEKWRSEVREETSKYGLDENLMMALLNQESGGRHPDLFQSSASAGLPNNTLVGEASIDQGVKYFNEMLKKAGGDVAMALQAYNMGGGYIDFANKRGGHSKETAQAYSEHMKAKYGYGVYGDPNYVDHVMRYYPKMDASRNGGNFFEGWQSRITSRYGDTSGRSKPHGGLDINGEQGDAVQSLVNGKVKFLYMDDGGKYDSDGRKNTRGGGTELGIEMANGETVFYSHLSKVDPKIIDSWFSGNKNINVGAGQYVGNVGGDPGMAGSGSSTTGSHLHVGYLAKNGYYKDPEPLVRSLVGGKGDSDVGYFAGSDRGDSGIESQPQPQSLDFTRRSLGDVLRYYSGSVSDVGDSDIGITDWDSWLENYHKEHDHSDHDHSHDHSHGSSCTCKMCSGESTTSVFDLGAISLEKLGTIIKEITNTFSKTSSEVQKVEHTHRSTIDVNLNVSGEGASQLNNATLAQLESVVKRIMKANEAERLSFNPSMLQR